MPDIKHLWILEATQTKHIGLSYYRFRWKRNSIRCYFSAVCRCTGRRGPATWEAGTYPDGEENYPVTGVSWYEAEAYATYAHKQLPTVFHWSQVAETSRTMFVVPLSNFNGKSTTPVGSNPGYCTFGIYDLAGNARE